MKQLLKLRLHTRNQYQLLCQTFTLLHLVRLGLWLLPFKKLRQLLSKFSHHKQYIDRHHTLSTNQIVRAVEICCCFTPGEVKCLARALVTQTLLLRYGHAPKLCIGVAKGKKGKLEAHAWVENKGQIVIGNLINLTHFTILPSLDAPNTKSA